MAGNRYNLGMAGIMDELREMVESSGISRYRISNDTGIHESQLSRFIHGKRGLSIEVVEQLVEYFGSEIVIRRSRKKGKRYDR